MIVRRVLGLATVLLSSSLVFGCQDEGPVVGTPVDPRVDPPAPPPVLDITDKAAPDAIPDEGTVVPELGELDNFIKAFMRATCTGAVGIAIGMGGKPLLTRGYGFKSGPPTAKCAAAGDPFVGGAHVMPNTAFRLGSNSKAITAAIVRTVLQQKLAKMGRPTTDEELERLEVFAPENNLVSPRVRDAVLGAAGTSPVGQCVPGRSAPVTANGRPDPRWRAVTVGHLLGHRSGLPRSFNPVTSKLARIRGITSESELASEANFLGAPGAAKADLANQTGGGRFLRGATLEEAILGNADLCFTFAPGGDVPANTNPYSNGGYAILEHIAEHVSGLSLAAPLGAPEEHSKSLLAQLLETRLGITKGKDSAYGIYMSQPIDGLRDPSEPKYRGWDGTSLNGFFADTKRPSACGTPRTRRATAARSTTETFATRGRGTRRRCL